MELTEFVSDRKRWLPRSGGSCVPLQATLKSSETPRVRARLDAGRRSRTDMMLATSWRWLTVCRLAGRICSHPNWPDIIVDCMIAALFLRSAFSGLRDATRAL